MYNAFGRRPNMGVGTVLGTNNEDFGNCITTVISLVNIADAWLSSLKVIYITECGFDDLDKVFTWAQFLWMLEWAKKNVSGIKSDHVEALEIMKKIDVKNFVGKFKDFRTKYFDWRHEPSHEERQVCSDFLGRLVYEGRRLHWALKQLYWDIKTMWKRQRMCAFLLGL